MVLKGNIRTADPVFNDEVSEVPEEGCVSPALFVDDGL